MLKYNFSLVLWEKLLLSSIAKLKNIASLEACKNKYATMHSTKKFNKALTVSLVTILVNTRVFLYLISIFIGIVNTERTIPNGFLSKFNSYFQICQEDYNVHTSFRFL